MKKLLLLLLIIPILSFGQSPVKVIRVANKTALFVDNLPKSTIIIDTQTKSRYLTLLPVLGTKSIATCTGLELRLDVINGDLIEVLTATDTTESVSPRNMFDYLKANNVPYIGANQDLNLGSYGLVGDTINGATMQIGGVDIVQNATHTGDVTGSTALTLATVNSNIGTFNNVTINAKGLATAGSNVSYLVAADISGKKDKSDSTAIDGYTRRDRLASELANKQQKLNGTGFVKATGTTISYDNSTYEPAFTKNTGFNKNFGSVSGTVLEGRTFGTAANNNTGDFEVPLTFSSGLQRSVNTVTTFLGSLSNDITATTSDYIPWIDVGTSSDKKMTIATLSNLTSKWTTGTYGISNSGNVGIGAVADANYRFYSSANVADYGAKISNTSMSGKGLLIQGGSAISHAFSIVPFGGGSLSYFNVFGNGVVQMYQATPGTSTAGNGLLFVDTDDKIKWKTSTTTYDLTGGMTNPMTTVGDIIYASVTGTPATPAILGIGAAGKFLGVASGLPTWLDVPNNSGFIDNGAAVNLITQSRTVGIGVAADISKKINVLSSSGHGIYSYNAPNIAIQGEATSGVGVRGLATTGTGFYGQSTSGIGGRFTSASNYAVEVQVDNTTINTVAHAINIVGNSTGTGTTGFGTGINFVIENTPDQAQINVVGSFDGTYLDQNLEVKLSNNGSASSRKLYLNSEGQLDVGQYKLTSLNIAPASATATGTTGEIRVTADFIYVCIATNTWKRTQLTTW